MERSYGDSILISDPGSGSDKLFEVIPILWAVWQRIQGGIRVYSSSGQSQRLRARVGLPGRVPGEARMRVLEGVKINAFVLERAPQPRDEHSVHPERPFRVRHGNAEA